MKFFSEQYLIFIIRPYACQTVYFSFCMFILNIFVIFIHFTWVSKLWFFLNAKDDLSKCNKQIIIQVQKNIIWVFNIVINQMKFCSDMIFLLCSHSIFVNVYLFIWFLYELFLRASLLIDVTNLVYFFHYAHLLIHLMSKKFEQNFVVCI